MDQPVVDSRQPIARLIIVVAVLAFAIALAIRSARFWVFTLDDSFITLRYAAHAAHGLGPSWNPAGPPAEGYTTTLWLAVLALVIKLGADGLLAAKLAGIVFAVASVAVASRLAWSLSRTLPPWPRALATAAPWLLSIAYWPLSLHAVSGMETTCSAFVLSLFFLLAYEVQRRGDGTRTRALALSALFACLARPEAVLVCGIALFMLDRELAIRPRLRRAALLYTVLPGAIYYAIRYYHFRLLFPLSFYVKATGQAPLAGLSDVVEFFTLFIVRPWWLVLVVFGVLDRPALRPVLVGAAAFALFFVFPEHVMAFESRYMIPLFPLIAGLAGAGVGNVASWLVQLTRDRMLSFIAVGTALALFALVPVSFEPSPERWLDYGRNLTRAHVAFAHALKGAPHGSVAMLDVGAVGYYADTFVIDTYGLNDAHVALAHRRDVAYVLDQRPDLLVVISATQGKFTQVFDFETPLHTEAARRGYRYTCDFPFEPGYYLHILARTDVPERDAVLCRAAELASASSPQTRTMNEAR